MLGKHTGEGVQLSNRGSRHRGAGGNTGAQSDLQVSDSSRDDRQSRIREALAIWIEGRRPELAEVAQSLATAIHPWPDWPLSSAVLLEFLDELDEGRNATHPDSREVAADRLLRLVEVLRHAGEGPADLVEMYEKSATDLGESLASDEIRSPSEISDAVACPSASNLMAEQASTGRWPAGATAGGDFDRQDLLAVLVGSACRSGSLDLGVNLGGGEAKIDLLQLVNAVGTHAPLASFDRWLGAAESRVATLVAHRVFLSGAKSTLQELGDEWDLSRERVRQMEVKVRESIDERLGQMLHAAARPLESARSFVLPRQRHDLLVGLVLGKTRYPTQASAAVREYSGPWIHDGDWVYHETLRDEVAVARDAVLDSADQHGVLAEDAPAHLDGLFASEDDQLLYFRSALEIVQLSGYWAVRESLRTRVVASLRRIGRPATKSEIAEVADLDEGARLGSTLSVLDGIVRADKERWGFEAWVDDEYDGIAGEIDQRIEAHSGSVAVASLLDELPRKFGVSENSVMMYLQTPAYVVEEGFIRRSEPGSFNAAPPSKWSDAYHSGGAWGQVVQIEPRHLEGYSLKVRFDIAYANGLRPGCDLRVPVAGTDLSASIIWRPHDVSGGIDVGRVSNALADLGFGAGDLVLVLPTSTGVLIREPLAAIDSTQGESEAAHGDPLLDLLREE